MSTMITVATMVFVFVVGVAFGAWLVGHFDLD